MSDLRLGSAPAVPILRIFDQAVAYAFYLDHLAFTVEWEHRFEPDLPLYARVCRDSTVLDLSEHHGDGTPGTVVSVPIADAQAFLDDLRSRPHPRMRPAVERDAPGGPVVQLTDPFGNVLRFCEVAET